MGSPDHRQMPCANSAATCDNCYSRHQEWCARLTLQRWGITRSHQPERHSVSMLTPLSENVLCATASGCAPFHHRRLRLFAFWHSHAQSIIGRNSTADHRLNGLCYCLRRQLICAGSVSSQCGKMILQSENKKVKVDRSVLCFNATQPKLKIEPARCAQTVLCSALWVYERPHYVCSVIDSSSTNRWHVLKVALQQFQPQIRTEFSESTQYRPGSAL